MKYSTYITQGYNCFASSHVISGFMSLACLGFDVSLVKSSLVTEKYISKGWLQKVLYLLLYLMALRTLSLLPLNLYILVEGNWSNSHLVLDSVGHLKIILSFNTKAGMAIVSAFNKALSQIKCTNLSLTIVKQVPNVCINLYFNKR